MAVIRGNFHLKELAMTIRSFQTKPEVVQAVQFIYGDANQMQDLKDLLGDEFHSVSKARTLNAKATLYVKAQNLSYFGDPLEDPNGFTALAKEGDWIVKHADGSFYSVNADEFLEDRIEIPEDCIMSFPFPMKRLPPRSLMGLHEEIASGQFGDAKVRFCVSVGFNALWVDIGGVIFGITMNDVMEACVKPLEPVLEEDEEVQT